MAPPLRAQSPLARPQSASYATPSPQSVQTTGAHWLITAQEKAQYDAHFATIDSAGKGVLSGEQAVRFFSDSRLPEDTLASVWDLADINSEGQLNKDEFAVAMYLIRQQRAPNPPPLPAFLPSALVPPSMRGQQAAQQASQPNQHQQQQQAAARTSTAADDLFGLDSSPAQAFGSVQSQAAQPTSQTLNTDMTTTRDPFAGSQPNSPSSPQRFQPQPQSAGASTVFKQFVPSSAFGASLASQNTGGSVDSSQGQTRGFAPSQQVSKAPMPSALDDLLGDNDTSTAESGRLTNESSELANMSSQIGNLRSEMESTQAKKTSTQADLTAATDQKRDLEQRLAQFRAQYQEEVRNVKEMEQMLASSRESTKKLNQDFAMLQGTHQDLQTQHETISQQLQADQKENASLKQRIGELNTEVSKLKPEIEKMKLDARQQKGLVSINKKQLTTNENERDRLQQEKADLEREAAQQARSLAASPEPAAPRQAASVASPGGSTVSSKNPFFRGPSVENTNAAPPTAPTPSAFDALFGPSSHFAPSGQAASRSGTPPATSFIGRSVPTAAPAPSFGAGTGGMADSMSSAGDPTPSATPPPSNEQTRDLVFGTPSTAEPASPSNEQASSFRNMLTLGGPATSDSRVESDGPTSTIAPSPHGQTNEVEENVGNERSATPATPSVSGMPGAFAEEDYEPEQSDREIIPGAFPSDEAQPSTVAQEVSSPEAPSTQAASPMPQRNLADDFDSAFAGFGGSDRHEALGNSGDPFAPAESRPPQQTSSNEFPPIQNFESEDDSASDDDEEPSRGFGDSFTAASPPRDATTTMAEPVMTETATAAAASDLPDISSQTSPPDYGQSDDSAGLGSNQRSASNQFPPEFGDLLPSREDPTSPPPASAVSLPAQTAMRSAPMNYAEDEITPAPRSGDQLFHRTTEEVATPQPSSVVYDAPPSSNADSFFDAQSQPTSAVPDSSLNTFQTANIAPAPPVKNAFDDFDDFDNLSEAKVADQTGSDLDFGFGRQSQDEFNPAFDSPPTSQTPTPMKPAERSQEGRTTFLNFAPDTSSTSTTASTFSTTNPNNNTSGSNSIQQTPQNVQHDWDSIFSGLDSGSSKPVNTTFANDDDEIWQPPPGPPPGRQAIPNGSAPTRASHAAKPALPGRAVTPGTEHDDPILKRLTGMGYQRSDALSALERYDYDINKVGPPIPFVKVIRNAEMHADSYDFQAVDHLAGS